MISLEAFDDLPELYFLLSLKGEIQFINNTAEKTLKFKHDEVKGTLFTEICFPGSMLKFQHIFITSIQQNRVLESEIRMQDIEGKVFDVDITLKPFKDKKKSSELYVLVIIRDITAEKKKEFDLLRFQYVTENAVNPLQITDLSGKMIYVNPAFVKASGYEAEELIGQNPRIFGSGKHTKSMWDAMWQTISVGKTWVGEVENRRKDGSTFFTELLISPIVNEVNTVVGYFGIHRDLTDQRNLEKQLMQTQKMESIGTLAAGVAHEVGNPLASISALAQIIQRSTQDVFIVEKLELIKNQINRISKIIRDLVDFSRPSNYELKLTDINENLKEAIDIVKVGKKARDVKFEFQPDSNLLPIKLVSDQIQQVFVNILINAVDALDEKKRTVHTEFQPEITVSSRISADSIIIVFKDNGTGIPEEFRAKIFEPFFTTKVVGKGTGLGLWVSYGIIKSFQGTIKVNSKSGEGTKFTIEIPLYPAN